MKVFNMTIGGNSISASDHFDVINPADESVVASCPHATEQLVDEAVAAAKNALPSWASMPDEERSALLMRLADLLEANATELATLITQEQGKPTSGPGAPFEIGGCAAWTRVTAGLKLEPEIIQNDEKGRITAIRKPVGVVGSITPWNWPLLIATLHVIPALRVGCTVVIKPSPFTPLSTLRRVELYNTILPPGVLNVVTGEGEIGARLASHPNVDKIVFTGSVATGKKIMSMAAEKLKRLTLELGGNDAGIVLPGTNIEPLLEKLFWGCFINAGQTCAALKRLYVHSSQYEAVVEKLANFAANIPVGDGMDPNSLIGPLSNRMQLEKVMHFVENAKNSGAKIVLGGEKKPGKGFFYPLTVIADATDDMLVVKEEQFGPVIPVIRYETIDEALTKANSLDLGLGGSIWGNDTTEAAKVAARLECGTAWVNSHGGLHPLAPFGGIKCSGIGSQNNLDGLKEFTTVQVINETL